MTESSKLLEARIKLAKAYASTNENVVKAQTDCAKAKAAVIAFDEEHPEIMAAVKQSAGERKKAYRAAEIAAAKEAGEGEQ